MLEKCFVAFTPPWKQEVWVLAHSGLQDWPGRHVDIGCHPYNQTSMDVTGHFTLSPGQFEQQNNQQGKKTCNFAVCIALNIIIIKGLKCPCPPKFWSALSEPESVQLHQLSAGWKERIWRLGIPLYHGILGVSLGHAETRSSIPQLSVFTLPP